MRKNGKIGRTYISDDLKVFISLFRLNFSIYLPSRGVFSFRNLFRSFFFFFFSRLFFTRKSPEEKTTVSDQSLSDRILIKNTSYATAFIVRIEYSHSHSRFHSLPFFCFVFHWETIVFAARAVPRRAVKQNLLDTGLTAYVHSSCVAVFSGLCPIANPNSQ